MKYKPLSILVAMLPLMALAQVDPVYYTPELGDYTSSDWHLVCDNISTCRAVGYHGDDESHQLVSLLIKQEAGNHKLQAYVNIEKFTDGDDTYPKTTPTFIIGERSFGKVTPIKDGIYKLSDAQIKAVLDNAKLKTPKVISLSADHAIWQLSNLGMTDTLNKMSVIQKGAKKSSDYPVLNDKPITAVRLSSISLKSTQGQALKRLLLTDKMLTDDAMSCDILGDDEEEAWLADSDKDVFDIWQITADKHLVVGSCFSGAYNFGYGVWVVSHDHKHLYQTVSLATDGYDGESNRLSAYFKGRGIGDCATIDEWTWDGSRFVHTLSASTGQCKGFAGGAWFIPSKIVKVADQKPISEIW